MGQLLECCGARRSQAVNFPVLKALQYRMLLSSLVVLGHLRPDSLGRLQFIFLPFTEKCIG